MTIKQMTAKELWEELDALRRERADFDTLDVFVEVIDRASYEEQEAITEADIGREFTERIMGEGIVFGMIVPSGIDREGNDLGDYICIRAVDEDEEED